MQITFSDDAARDGGMLEFLDLLKGRTFAVLLTDGTTTLGAIAEAGDTHLTLGPMFWALDDGPISIPYNRIERMEYQ